MEIAHSVAVAQIGRELDRKRALDLFEKLGLVAVADEACSSHS
jgi:hypothetical protein